MLIFLVLFYVFSILLITVLMITVQMTFTRWPVGITAWYAIAMPCS